MKKIILLTLLFALIPSAHAADSSQADPNGFVTQKKFNKMIEIMRHFYEQLHELEAKLKDTSQSKDQTLKELADLKKKMANFSGATAGGKSTGADDGEVNLEDLSNSEVKTADTVEKPMPLFKVYFDFNLTAAPGLSAPDGGSGLTFNNYHSYIMLDMFPEKDIHFFTDVNPSPKFYEINWHFAEPFTIRLGKIFIPFDDMYPHNIFGGRVNVSTLLPTGVGSFLPDLYADLGVGLDTELLNTANFNWIFDSYVVNGFQSGGTDPVTSSSKYPNFPALLPTSTDTNKNKSYGARTHLLVNNAIGLGTSYYHGRWSDQNDPALYLSMLGFDAQLYYRKTSLRVGTASMKVDLPSTATTRNFIRSANYVELMTKFGANDRWRPWIRAGQQDLDDRIVNIDDRQIVGGGLAFKPNVLEFSIEYGYDTKYLVAKTNYSFTNFRVVASF